MMKGKTCLIPGATAGIGLETARGLARMGAGVILLCRDAARGEAVRREIGAELLVADLASQPQVRALSIPPVDVLINNAGT